LAHIKGPRFRTANIQPNRKLLFNYRRRLPFGKKGVKFRNQGVSFRKRGVTFGKRGVQNIKLKPSEDPYNLNNQGVKFYNEGKYKVALRYFEKALAVAPQFDIARENRRHCIKMIRLTGTPMYSGRYRY
jgi:hypothetical protein